MKNLMQVLLTVTFISSLATAQVNYNKQDVEQRLDSELERVYDDEVITKVRRTRSKADANNIVIYNNHDQQSRQNAIHDQNTAQDVVQEQPTTYVQASPLVDSNAKRIRNARKQMEFKTEEKIVEKLEYSRMEDERARSERLFGGKIAPVHGAYAVKQTYVVAKKEEPKVVVEVTTKKVDNYVAPTTYGVEADIIKPVSATNYVMGVIGSQSYDASNVESKSAAGVGIGMLFSTHFALEGTFMYSQHQLTDVTRNLVTNNRRGYRRRSFRATSVNPLINVDQYSITGAVKYVRQHDRLKPYVGATLGVSYRSYDDEYVTSNSSYDDTTSIDAGLVAGVDVMITNNFSLGADLRYATNMSNSREVDRYSSNTTPLEEIDTQSMLLNAKFNF